MERCTIVRWGIVFCFLCCSGCSTTRGMNTASWWRGKDATEKTSDEKVASRNPFKRDNKKTDKEDTTEVKQVAAADTKKDKKEKADKPTEPAKPGDSATKQVAAKDKPAASKVTSHDAETLKLIEEELKDLPPAERERLYAEWKPLDSGLVKQLIRIRRMVRQTTQQSPAQQIAQNGAAGAPDPLKAGMSIQPRGPEAMAAGGSTPQLQTAGRAPTSQLGISPWGQTGDPNGSSQYGAIDTSPTAAGATSPYGSFSPATQPGSPMQDPRINLAAGGPNGADALGYRQDTTLPNGFGTIPTASPIGVAPTNGMSGNAMASVDQNAMTITPGRPGQPGTVANGTQQFSGAVSSNGGPQIIAGGAPGGLSPYYPPKQSAAAASPGTSAAGGNILPVSAQTAGGQPGYIGDQPALPNAVPQPQNITPQTTQQLQPQPSGLSAFGVGRFLNGAANNPALPSAGGHVSQASGKWAEDLQRVITSAAADVSQTGPGTTEAERRSYIEKHVYLRMLFLMAGQQVRAMEPIPGIDPGEQEFWQQMFWGMSSYFDAAAIPDAADRSTQTALQLRGALQRLQEKARLELRNVNFCHKISSFGNYERFQRDEFSAGQPVLVYAEVSNFKSDQTSDGWFRTVLKSSIEIYNSRGELIQSMPFPPTEDLCKNQRRDYFHSYEFTVPQRIAIGPHVMKLTVEDQISQKLATYTLNFTVK